MVHSQAERGVRRPDGRRAGPLSRRVRLGASGGDVLTSPSKQLLGDVRPPIEAAPGRVERYDTEYQRNGTRNLFMFCEPKGGWRHVEVTGRRTAVDFAQQMKWLVDQAYPDAAVIRLVTWTTSQRPTSSDSRSMKRH